MKWVFRGLAYLLLVIMYSYSLRGEVNITYIQEPNTVDTSFSELLTSCGSESISSKEKKLTLFECYNLLLPHKEVDNHTVSTAVADVNKPDPLRSVAFFYTLLNPGFASTKTDETYQLDVCDSQLDYSKQQTEKTTQDPEIFKTELANQKGIYDKNLAYPTFPKICYISPSVETSSSLKETLIAFENAEPISDKLLNNIPETSPDYSGLVQIRGGIFFPTSSKFRSVYGHQGFDFQVEGGFKINSQFEGWGNIDWVLKDKSFCDCCSATTYVANLSFGLKYVYPFSTISDVYLGVGPSFGKAMINERSGCVRVKKSKYVFGAVLKMGVRFYYNSFFIDLFGDYLDERPRYNKHRVNIGGWKTGVGFGYRF